MQRKNLLASVVLSLLALTMAVSANAQELLTGDTRLACEAVLCLAAGKRPEQCNPSLQRYFSISYKKFSDTVKARGNFLKLCPSSNQSPQMQSFVSALANGAGRCDATSLNAALLMTMWVGDQQQNYVSNQLPDYCSAYISNPYSNIGDQTPKYVGIPERGGYWIAASDYDAALASYNAQIAAQDAANANNLNGAGGI